MILAVASAFFGLIVGGGAVYTYEQHYLNQFCVNVLTAEAGNDLAELKWLRGSETANVIELMEVNLDGDLIGLGGFLRDPHELKRDPAYIKLLQRARDYRGQFPRKSASMEVDEATAKCFHLLDGQNP
jgi:hypothetical protein